MSKIVIDGEEFVKKSDCKKMAALPSSVSDAG